MNKFTNSENMTQIITYCETVLREEINKMHNEKDVLKKDKLRANIAELKRLLFTLRK